MSQPILSSRNRVERDAQIKFYARGHKYEISSDKGSKYTSVTTWNHSHFPKFDADKIIENIFKSKSWGPDHKYWGQTAEQIKASWKSNGEQVAGAGTNLHERIEIFMNNEKLRHGYHLKDLYEEYVKNNKNIDNEVEEWNYFIQFVKDFENLKPYRTEWMIFDEELKLAGSIDMVFQNEDGTLSIYDWKRSKEISKINNWNQYATNPLICHMPDTNFWHYTLQLNTYKTILERKYDKKIKDLYLVRLHPLAEEKTYELITVPVLDKEMFDLFEERKKEVSQ